MLHRALIAEQEAAAETASAIARSQPAAWDLETAALFRARRAVAQAAPAGRAVLPAWDLVEAASVAAAVEGGDS